MSKHTTETINLVRVERANISTMGNPSFWFYDDRGRRWRTSTDSSVAYGATNWFSRSTPDAWRRNCTIVLTAAGRIVDAYTIHNDKEVRP